MEINSEIPQKEVMDALLDDSKYSLKRWKLVSTLEGDKELMKEIDTIKRGINIEFDIRLILNGFFEEMPQMDIVKIRKKVQINVYEFWDEMEERDKKMKEIIRELVDDSFDNQMEPNMKEYDK